MSQSSSSFTMKGETLKEFTEAIQEMTNVVGSTLGPGGRPVMISDNGHNFVTKDGVTVARNYAVGDGIKGLATSMILEAANKTVQEAGDGTTSTVIMSNAIIKAALEAMRNGESYFEVMRALRSAPSILIDGIRKEVVPVVDEENRISHAGATSVAYISTNGDLELSDKVATAHVNAGPFGNVALEQSSNSETTVESKRGITIAAGAVSESMLVGDGVFRNSDGEKTRVIIYAGVINRFPEMGKALLESIAQKERVLIICDGMTDEALATVNLNAQRGKMKICAVQAPFIGPARRAWMRDAATLLGSNVIGHEMGVGWNKYNAESDSALSDNVTVTRYTTIIEPSNDPAVMERVKKSLEEIASSTEDEQIKAIRLRTLQATSVVLRVGAKSMSEFSERRDRAEDALESVRSAVQEGVVAGASGPLIRVSSIFADIAKERGEVAMFHIFTACQEVLRQLLRNYYGTDEKADEIIKELRAEPYTSYSPSEDKVVNGVKTGIIDAAKVVRVSIENAFSVALNVVSSGGIIIKNEGKE